MVEVPSVADVKSVEIFSKALDSLKLMYDKLNPASKAALDSIKSGAAGFLGIGEAVKKATGDLGSFNTILDFVKKELGDATTNQEAIISFGSLGSTIALLTTDALSAKDSLAQFNSQLSSADKSSNDVAASIKGLIEGLPLGKFLGEATVRFTEAATQAKSFENSLLEGAIAGGNFYDTIQQGGGNLSESLTHFTTKIAAEANKSALALGISYPEALKRTSEVFRSLPGEATAVYSAIDGIRGDADRKMFSSMELLSQAARGTGLAYSTAMDIAKEAIGTFGLSGRDAAVRMSVMAQAGKDLKIPFEDIKGVVSGVDQNFKFWGSQMDSTIGILGRMTDALKDSGVGFKGQIELVKGLESAIQNMQMPMRSYIALSAGMQAPGGMIGAGLQVEKLMQQGKSGEVMDMMQETLEKKSGIGRTLTLDEAAESPELQQSFVVQRQLLSQMTGNSDVGQLNRIMEAMSKTTLGGAGEDKAANEAVLTKALTGGREMMEGQTNMASQQLKVAQDQLAVLEAIKSRTTEREIFAPKKGELDYIQAERSRTGRIGDDAKEFKTERLQEESGRATSRVATAGIDSGKRLLTGFEETTVGQKMMESFEKANEEEIKKLEKKGDKTADDKKKLTDLINNRGKTLTQMAEKFFPEEASTLVDTIRDVGMNRPTIHERPLATKREEKGGWTIESREKTEEPDFGGIKRITPVEISKAQLNVAREPFKEASSSNKFEDLTININLTQDGKVIKAVIAHMEQIAGTAQHKGSSLPD